MRGIRLGGRDSTPLQQAILGKRVRSALADDEVIQHPDVDQIQSVLEPAGDRAIGCTGLRVPRGMLVREDAVSYTHLTLPTSDLV